MKTTGVQPPNMKGKKLYRFKCGCCWARNCLQEERRKIDLKEAKAEIATILSSPNVDRNKSP